MNPEPGCYCTLDPSDGALINTSHTCLRHSQTESEAVTLRGFLVNQLRALRYSGQNTAPLPHVLDEDSEEQFLEELIEWVGGFMLVLTSVSETTTDMAKELTDLRTQRKAVRDFLGLNTKAVGA